MVSLWPWGPAKNKERWARSQLTESETRLWLQMSRPDRRHAVAVAYRVDQALGGAERSVLVAALLHDIGKVDSGLSTLARVVATLFGILVGDRARIGQGRVARYLRHPEIGAQLLVEAGSCPLAVTWAREHHLPLERSTVDFGFAKALSDADND